MKGFRQTLIGVNFLTLYSMSTRRPFRKLYFIIPVLILTGIVLAIALRLTFVLQVFSFDSTANAPTIPAGRVVLTSNLSKPKLFDFIVFQNSTQPGSPIWISRLCGKAGDSIEIRSGDLFVNGRPVDSLLTLSHSYVVFPKDTAGMNVKEMAAVPLTFDSVDNMVITYPDQLMRQKDITYRRFIVPQEIADAHVQKIFNQPWNLDHFGPVTVPADSYFVLGDNRSNAIDSRYIGFIRKKDFKGTVLRY